jgi:aldehyde:ferredoxin oxidoreductase
MAKIGGWAGKVLRVDLSTGRISTENTIEKYKDYLGGTGIGYKVIWDEVPTGTKPFDPANKIIFAVGPLAAPLLRLFGLPVGRKRWSLPDIWADSLLQSSSMPGTMALSSRERLIIQYGYRS